MRVAGHTGCADIVGFSRPDTTSAIALLEGCLPLIEYRYLHTCVAEPWCIITMLAIISILEDERPMSSDTLQSTARRFQAIRDKRLEHVSETSQSLSEDLTWTELWEDEWSTDWLTMDAL